MGGLAKLIPFTWAMMLIGNLALTGVGIPVLGIGAAGFYSKDSIINAAFNAGTPMGRYAFWLTLTAAAMTSFYSWRQFLMTFHGPFRGATNVRLPHADADARAHDEPLGDHDGDHGHGHAVDLSSVHESPMTMLVPLVVLAVGALLAGGVFDDIFIGGVSKAFWHSALGAIAGHHGLDVPLWVEFAPTLLTAIGFAVAYYYYVLYPEVPPELAAQGGPLYRFLYNKWYFDELYDFLFVRPAMALGRILWKIGDGTIIDGLGPDGISARVMDATRETVRLQTGYVYHYAFAMLIGVVALATWFMLRGGLR
jgi:NADH-quinone oxidoreductase subunit L